MVSPWKSKVVSFPANDHLIEFHLTEIDIFHLIEIVVISWPNFWTLFTWSKLKIMNSVKCLNLGVWPNYSIKCQKRTYGFWHLIECFLKPKIPLLELSINWLNLFFLFSQLIETFINVKNIFTEQSGRKEWLDWIRRKKSSCFLFIYLPCIKNWFATDT